LPEVIEPENITAIIHSHSKWSDGNNTIEEMAKAAIAKGFNIWLSATIQNLHLREWFDRGKIKSTTCRN
jgi:hypothetical protein